MTDALAPCPFCGGKADWDSSDTSNHQWIFCTICSAEMRGADPFMAWNRRPSSPGDAERERLREAVAKNEHEIEQTLGKALGYPWYKDDPKNFPDAIEADGVCVGEHVAATLAQEAAERIRVLSSTPAGWRPEEIDVVNTLIDLVYRVYTVLDDSEDVGGFNYLVPADSASDVVEIINKLSELPDDKPGAVMGPAAKVRWALRRILPLAPPASKEGV